MSWFDDLKTVALPNGHKVSLDDKTETQTISAFIDELDKSGWEKESLSVNQDGTVTRAKDTVNLTVNFEVDDGSADDNEDLSS